MTRLRSTLSLTPMALVVLAAALVVGLPPLLLSPWLPFLDLTAFVGLNGYPPQASYGPFQYYVFQFTYIGHYALSRLLSDLHVPIPQQIVAFYLLQAGVAFTVVWRSLSRLVAGNWLRSVATALGCLAFWDGLFLWGGPLPFSLAAACLTAAMYLTMRESAEPGRKSGGLVFLLALFGVVCHPFALPFALLLGGLRLVFVPDRRVQSLGLMAALAVFGLIVVRDSPANEGAALSNLGILFAPNGSEIAARCADLFSQDIQTVKFLLGACPGGLQVYYIVLGVVHLAGFATAPVMAWFARDSRWLRMLGVLNTVVALLYFFSRNAPLTIVPHWPQRILTFYSPFTFLAGVVGPLYLVRRFWRPGRVAAGPVARIWWLAPVAILAGLALVQIPVFRLGDNVRLSLEQTRAEIVGSGVSNAYLVVADLDAVQPFYLRCVPFLLFSDPQIVAHRLAIYTEWHFQPRHPTRLAESWFDLGRARYQASFSAKDSLLHVQLVTQPAGQFPVLTRTNESGWGQVSNIAKAQCAQGTELAYAGDLRDAAEHYETAVRLEPNYAEAHNNLGWVLNATGRVSDAIPHFEAALRIVPSYADAHVNLAIALLNSGRTTEAIGHLQTALRLNPDSAMARELLARATAAK